MLAAFSHKIPFFLFSASQETERAWVARNGAWWAGMLAFPLLCVRPTSVRGPEQAGVAPRSLHHGGKVANLFNQEFKSIPWTAE